MIEINIRIMSEQYKQKFKKHRKQYRERCLKKTNQKVFE